MNYWKQLTHIMKYFRQEEDPTAKLPRNFISGFLEVSDACLTRVEAQEVDMNSLGTKLIYPISDFLVALSIHSFDESRKIPTATS